MKRATATETLDREKQARMIKTCGFWQGGQGVQNAQKQGAQFVQNVDCE